MVLPAPAALRGEGDKCDHAYRCRTRGLVAAVGEGERSRGGTGMAARRATGRRTLSWPACDGGRWRDAAGAPGRRALGMVESPTANRGLGRAIWRWFRPRGKTVAGVAVAPARQAMDLCRGLFRRRGKRRPPVLALAGRPASANPSRFGMKKTPQRPPS